MTYSLIGLDRKNGEIGGAVQSKFPGVGSIVLHGRAGVGFINTQAFANPRHGTVGLDLMGLGATAEEALTVLLRDDAQGGSRQIGMVSARDGIASHTGSQVASWRGSSGVVEGTDCIALGNSLSNDIVLSAMIKAYSACEGSLTERLLNGLAAGRDAGGEIRGEQSAAILVLKEGGGYGGGDTKLVDISVYDHSTPIAELSRCYQLHRLSYFPSREEDLIPITDKIAATLRDILRKAGFDRVSDAGPWQEADIVALKRFMGEKNYDNRLRDDDLIDKEVLDDMIEKNDA